ncbi:MAG TPA: Holliday junction branch migration protein RuvA [Erysipelotrichaceae bacterium]|nr:Holliday junction branch migration protein RuvA [Erysipelotrichaceae bacterium]
MIAFISGRVHSFTQDWVIIENQGIGYRVFFAHPEALSLNQQVSLYTYHYIREDEQSLYGFLSMDEYDLFVKLISVKGLGCKTASNILAASTFERIIMAIEVSDVAYLKTMPGIGAKTASQIILDLKGKLVATHTKEQTGNPQLMDAMEALKSLGYKPGEISSIQKDLVQSTAKTSDEYVKVALGLLLKRKVG